ncbi:SpoIIE family protein phosphatase [Streptomyces sp. R11]|uniref:SpoIIE family protein phosphatase n=1 Tax=Streptomyces sp. R11 TaxID=3238625 RepID=A0AB39NE71_9ACTN
MVVGDVMGRSLPEAATTGRLRTAVHTLADLELPPDEIMSHVNDIVGGMGEESYVTCPYALYDSTTRICSIAGEAFNGTVALTALLLSAVIIERNQALQDACDDLTEALTQLAADRPLSKQPPRTDSIHSAGSNPQRALGGDRQRGARRRAMAPARTNGRG